jgi:hypothetical protein
MPRETLIGARARQTGKTWPASSGQPIKILKIPNCERLSLNMADRLPSPKSEDDFAIPESPEKLNLPTPRVPLREWNEQSIDPAVVVAAMEAIMQVARSQPDFEAQRLSRKTAIRFTY